MVALGLQEALPVRVDLRYNGHGHFQDGYFCAAVVQIVLAVCLEEVLVGDILRVAARRNLLELEHLFRRSFDPLGVEQSLLFLLLTVHVVLDVG